MADFERPIEQDGQSLEKEALNAIDEILSKLAAGQAVPEAKLLSPKEGPVGNLQEVAAGEHLYVGIPTGADNQYWVVPKSGLTLNGNAFNSYQPLYDSPLEENESLTITVPAEVVLDPQSQEFNLSQKGSIERMPPTRQQQVEAVVQREQQRVSESDTAIESLLNRVKAKLPPEKRDGAMRVVSGNQTLYSKNRKGEKSVLLDAAQVAAINRLVRQGDPSGIEQNSLRIYAGEKTPIFYAKHGAVQKDALQLFPQAPTVRAAPASESEGLEAVLKQLEQQSRNLEEQRERIKALEAKLMEVEQRPVQTASPMLNDWLNGVKQSAVSKARTFYQELSAKITTKIERGRQRTEQYVSTKGQQLNQGVQSVKQQVGHRIDTGKQAMRSGMQDAAAKWLQMTVVPAAATLLKHLGEKQADGTLSFSTQEYTFQQGKEGISIIRKSDGQALNGSNLTPRDKDVMGQVAVKVEGIKEEAKVQLEKPAQQAQPPKMRPKR